MKRALITGITGQDGSYLAELLLRRGYQVHGLVRRGALEDPLHRLWRIAHLLPQLQLRSVSLESHSSLFRAVEQVQPDECYHLAAHSVVSYAVQEESATLRTNIGSTHNILAALRQAAPQCRFYFAGSSELFGRAGAAPQNEQTPFHPRSAYGISKLAGFELTRSCREGHGLFALSGILYNHESPRRGQEFVSRKITSAVARIRSGQTGPLALGNLDARRDWGYAPDYVEAMWRMLQQPVPRDYVIATGQTHSVREFVELAFAEAGLDWRRHVVVDPALYRPSESVLLVGDASKAARDLGWRPTVSFPELVRQMVQADLAAGTW